MVSDAAGRPLIPSFLPSDLDLSVLCLFSEMFSLSVDAFVGRGGDLFLIPVLTKKGRQKCCCFGRLNVAVLGG